MRKINCFLAGFFMFLVILSSVGCSVSRALNQPEKKNMSVLNIGTHRNVVLAELGNPVASGEEDGKKYDIYSFVQGYTKGNKVGRAFGHGVLDVLSLGLWEVFANPIEGVASGEKIRLKIIYNEESRIEKVEKIEIPPEK